jgi:hypothetical protein
VSMDALCDAIAFNAPGAREPAHSDARDTIYVDARPIGPEVTLSSFTARRRTIGTPPDSQPQHFSGLTPQVYRCELCDRVYERPDHLSRHLKSHENARSFKCTECSKSFNRADLLSRHKASHERYAKGKKAPRMWRCDRVATACNACVASKSKCQDQKPCVRCQKKGVPCETSPQLGRVQSGVAPQASMSGDEDSTLVLDQEQTMQSLFSALANNNGPDHSGMTDPQARQLSSGSNIPATRHSITVENDIIVSDHVMSDNVEVLNTNSDYYNESQVTANTRIGQYDEIYNNEFSFLDQYPNFNGSLGYPQWQSYFSQDIDFGIADIDIESIDLLSENIEDVQSTDKALDPNDSNKRGANKDISKRYAAFERSPWLWKPTNNDQMLNDQQDISLDEESIPAAFTPVSPGASMSNFAFCSIDSRMRDKMLSLLFSLPKVDSRNHSFPSLPLLNTIIQVYFAQESYKADNFIHSATFSSSKSLPHLIMAIVSGGSTFISTPAIWKMGLALQEVVRHTVGDFVRSPKCSSRSIFLTLLVGTKQQ